MHLENSKYLPMLLQCVGLSYSIFSTVIIENSVKFVEVVNYFVEIGDVMY